MTSPGAGDTPTPITRWATRWSCAPRSRRQVSSSRTLRHADDQHPDNQRSRDDDTAPSPPPPAVVGRAPHPVRKSFRGNRGNPNPPHRRGKGPDVPAPARHPVLVLPLPPHHHPAITAVPLRG